MASELVRENRKSRLRWYVNLLARAIQRPVRAAALIRVVKRTPAEYIPLSDSLPGRALRDYFDQRVYRVFVRNRLCRGVAPSAGTFRLHTWAPPSGTTDEPGQSGDGRDPVRDNGQPLPRAR
jgi:hypothetical protein